MRVVFGGGCEWTATGERVGKGAGAAGAASGDASGAFALLVRCCACSFSNCTAAGVAGAVVPTSQTHRPTVLHCQYFPCWRHTRINHIRSRTAGITHRQRPEFACDERPQTSHTIEALPALWPVPWMCPHPQYGHFLAVWMQQLEELLQLSPKSLQNPLLQPFSGERPCQLLCSLFQLSCQFLTLDTAPLPVDLRQRGIGESCCCC